MRIETVDLYAAFGLAKPAGAAGVLTCYLAGGCVADVPGRRHPGVLILPGGGYLYTSKREGEPIALRFLAKGFHAFVLEYSCAPARYPTALQEAVLAMRWLRQNADRLALRPDAVAACGFSAGGHLCGCLGMRYDAPEAAAFAGGANVRPDALVLCYPVAVSWGNTHTLSFDRLCGGDDALRAALSLEKCVRPGMMPVFLWATRNDGSVPVRNSLLLAAALEQAGVDFALHIYAAGQHGLATVDEVTYPVGGVPAHSADAEGWLEAAAAFLREKGLTFADA